MILSRRSALGLLGALPAGVALGACRGRADAPDPTPAPTPPEAPAARAMRRAVGWLALAQAADGGWPSSTYGLFALGQATTPLVLGALVAAGWDDDDGIARACDKLLALRGDNGANGFRSQVPEYPVYSTSLTLSCLKQLRPDAAPPSAEWLLTQQLREAGGWGGHDAQGGFGMGSKLDLRPPYAGHVDLSMTRRAVQALEGLPFDGRDEAIAFVRRCRAPLGGFLYSPVERALNKGATQEVGYGTATCDGLVALTALGVPADDPDVTSALELLTAIHRTDRNPGLDGGVMEAFGPAMVGTYRDASAEVFSRFGGPDGWAEGIVEAVVADQRQDGSFGNESILQKEDDPLIATSFAVTALAWATPGAPVAG